MLKTEGKESMTQCSVIFVTMGKAVLLAVSQTPGLAACCTELGCPGQKKIELFSSILVFFVARLPLHTALYPALPLLPHRRGCSAQMWGNCSNAWDMWVTPGGCRRFWNLASQAALRERQGSADQEGWANPRQGAAVLGR